MNKKTKEERCSVFGTKEWASLNANCMDGCSHDCRYCYAKSMAVRFKRSTTESWPDETPRLDRVRSVSRKPASRVMFPTTHDITPEHVEVCIEAMRQLFEGGHEILLVSKPHLECIERICTEFEKYKNRILFRFTIGSAWDEVLSFWEPHAPGFDERIASLKHASEKGFQTSISCEPMLDDKVEDVVDAVEPYLTDSVWIGKMNLARGRIKVNGALDEETERKLDELLATQTDEKILELYERLKDNSKVKWKESIKKVAGIPLADEVGLDI